MQKTKRANVALWIVQFLLAGVFLFAGAAKLVMTAEQMDQGSVHFPILFLRFIGICEVLGAVGLILPPLLGIQRRLTPLAALGLAVITIGATVGTLVGGMGAVALFPFVVCLLAAVVAYGRRDLFFRRP